MKYSRWLKVTVGVWVISCALSYGHEFIAYMNDSVVLIQQGVLSFQFAKHTENKSNVCVGQSYGI